MGGSCQPPAGPQKSVGESQKTRTGIPRENGATPKPVFVPTIQTSTQTAYFAHYQNIRFRITIEDLSRVDAMIALQMRANGHSAEVVFAAIRDCALAIRTGTDKRRNWERYAQRTADYAFGFAGDKDLENNAKHSKLWRTIETLKMDTYQRSTLKLR